MATTESKWTHAQMKAMEPPEQSPGAYPQVLPFINPKVDDDYDDESRMDFQLAFVQNLVGPFARFNGVLAVANPPKATQNPSDGSTRLVHVFDELNFLDIPACLGLRSENLRFTSTESGKAAEKEEVGAWVAATLNDTALCQHQRTTRLQFMIAFGMSNLQLPEHGRQLSHHIVSLLRTEAAPDADLSTSCAMLVLLHLFKGGGNPLMSWRLLGCGGLDAAILLMHKLDMQDSLSAAIFAKRCDEVKCTPEYMNITVDRLDLETTVSCTLTGFLNELVYTKTPPHTLRVNSDEGGFVIFLSTDFNTFCTGIDGHKTLASPAVNAALRDILTSRRDLFWEVQEYVVDGKVGGLKNVYTLLMVIDSVRILRKAQGDARTDLDDLIALVPEEWQTVACYREGEISESRAYPDVFGRGHDVRVRARLSSEWATHHANDIAQSSSSISRVFLVLSHTTIIMHPNSHKRATYFPPTFIFPFISISGSPKKCVARRRRWRAHSSRPMFAARQHAMLPRLAGGATRRLTHGNRVGMSSFSGPFRSTRAAASQPSDAVGANIEVADANQRRDLAVVLVNPQIPGNTGTIARTCAATRVPLHLVGPLGFSLEDSQLKRAGLDYWNSVCVKVHDDWASFEAYYKGLGSPGRLVAFSKFGARPHAEEGAYLAGDWLLFGAETTGLPDAAHDACAASGGIRRIPIDEAHVRSLNLAVSAAVGTYEALRQIDGPPTLANPPRDDAPGTYTM